MRCSPRGKTSRTGASVRLRDFGELVQELFISRLPDALHLFKVREARLEVRHKVGPAEYAVEQGSVHLSRLEDHLEELLEEEQVHFEGPVSYTHLTLPTI